MSLRHTCRDSSRFFRHHPPPRLCNGVDSRIPSIGRFTCRSSAHRRRTSTWLPPGARDEAGGFPRRINAVNKITGKICVMTSARAARAIDGRLSLRFARYPLLFPFLPARRFSPTTFDLPFDYRYAAPVFTSLCGFPVPVSSAPA